MGGFSEVNEGRLHVVLEENTSVQLKNLSKKKRTD